MAFIPDITMEEVQHAISFSGNGEKGSCIPENSNIPKLQEQGTLGLCRILNQRDLAYLADEVGMGKTYQALGVAAMLIKQKPSAKVLIIAPKGNVQDNWCNDFNTFRAHNLRFENDISMQKYDRVCEFVEATMKGKLTNISVLRLTAFSSAVKRICSPKGKKYSLKKLIEVLKDKGYKIVQDPEDIHGNKQIEPRQAAYYYGYAINHTIKKFDLVIIDEAQNIRNINQATTLLNAMLGLKRDMDIEDIFQGEKLIFRNRVKKTLLLSATPAHRMKKDICDQLAYFMQDEIKVEQLTHEYLEQFMIRRLRTYEEKTKYECRENKVVDVNEKMTTGQKLFIALIQKKLVEKLNEIKKTDNKNIYKIGFLETFESYKASDITGDNSEDEEERKKEFENGNDHSKSIGASAPDKEVLIDLARSFEEFMEGSNMSYPPHPKLDFMNQEIAQKVHIENGMALPEKALIFVRRIASVNELTRRLQEQYEEMILSYWKKRLQKIGVRITKFEQLQKYFENNYLKSEQRQQMDEEDEEALDEVQDEETQDREMLEEGDGINKSSPLLEWLALKSTRNLVDGTKVSRKDFKYTAVSRFKLSLLENHQRSFVFDENYFLTACKIAGISADKQVNKIVTSEFIQRVANYIEVYENLYIKDKKRHTFKNTNLAYLIYYLSIEHLVKEDVFQKGNELLERYRTHYCIPEEPSIKAEKKPSSDLVRRVLKRESIWNVVQTDEEGHYAFLAEWQDEYTWKKRELIKMWATKFIKSSEMILELLYHCIQDEQKFVTTFSKEVLLNSQQSGAIRIFQLIQNYDYVKRILMPDEEEYKRLTYKYNPTVLDEQRQVVGAVGGINHSAKIKRFNTPFYPDVIVCTDVFKEGINMHLFCNKVYHYGLAWSPGDLEQRIGRVDRYFSKTHRKIISGEDPDAKVQIIYPYLGKTIDESQLKKVLRFKIEIDPLMDSSGDTSREIDTDTIDYTDIQKLAEYKPDEGERTINPFSGERYWKEDR